MRLIDDECTVIPIGGLYESVSRGQSTDGCCPDEVAGLVGETFVRDNGGDNFSMNDFSGGMYVE